MTKRLVIFDVDDTLFDWLRMWSTSFAGMLDAILAHLRIDEIDAKKRLRAFHVSVGTSEYAYSPRDLVAVFPDLTTDKAHELVHAFDQYRTALHAPLIGILDTLDQLATAGISVVAHTDAPPLIASSRIRALGLGARIQALFSTRSQFEPLSRAAELNGIRHTALDDRKPDKRALHSILEACGVAADEAVYVGDSLYRDIAMAQDCGVLDIHAKYGCDRDSSNYDLLRAVSHWTDEMIEAERALQRNRTVTPTLVAHAPSDLDELLRLS